MPSADSLDYGECVWDVLDGKDLDYYDELREHMETVGPEGDYAPVHVDVGANMDVYAPAWPVPAQHRRRMCMGNGHHRVKLALELGWTKIRTTDDVFESGDDYYVKEAA